MHQAKRARQTLVLSAERRGSTTPAALPDREHAWGNGSRSEVEADRSVLESTKKHAAGVTLGCIAKETGM